MEMFTERSQSAEGKIQEVLVRDPGGKKCQSAEWKMFAD